MFWFTIDLNILFCNRTQFCNHSTPNTFHCSDLMPIVSKWIRCPWSIDSITWPVDSHAAPSSLCVGVVLPQLALTWVSPEIAYHFHRDCYQTWTGSDWQWLGQHPSNSWSPLLVVLLYRSTFESHPDCDK